MFSHNRMEQAMKNYRSKIIMVLVTILMLLFSSACSTQNQFKQPLAPTMDLPTSTVASEITLPTSPLPDSNNTIPGVEIDLPTSTPQSSIATTLLPTNTPEAKKTCGESGSKTLLFIGSDVLGSSQPYGADSIRLIKVNFDTQTVKIITFPRDMFVSTGSVNSTSAIQQSLGLAYYTAFTAASGTPLEKNAVGASVVSQLLHDNFGVQPGNYITGQMDKFASMIDTVGGVEINIPAAITNEHNISFSAGVQTLNGAMATEYIRFLYPGGESARTARQNEVVKALQTKMININSLAQIPTLQTQFKDALITDLSIEQLTNLACLALTMPKTNITFGAITAPDLMNNNIPDVEKVKAYLLSFLGN
jgi:LCP family protein required for cell wall assembly